jgi:uncharacterized protein (DUF934 family)
MPLLEADTRVASTSPRRRGSTTLGKEGAESSVGARLRGHDVGGVRKVDPNGTVWSDGAFRQNEWVRVGDDETFPEAPAILSKKRWFAEREALASRNAPMGLLIAAGEGVDDIAGDLARFALIALDFPKFSDGRAFSTARLLREKHGFAGELRAVGNVLSDQISYMRRVGFDTFEVTHEPTRRALIEGRIAEVMLYYQPAGIAEAPAGTRPWLRHGPPAEEPR